MSRDVRDFTLALDRTEAFAACRAAISMVGWKEASSVGTERLVAKVGFGLFRNPSQIEAVILDARHGTRIQLNGSIKQVGPVATRALGKQLDQLQDAIEVSASQYQDPETAAAEAGTAPPTESAQVQTSVEERLARLAQLHKDSVISDEEYAEQRQRVLQEL